MSLVGLFVLLIKDEVSKLVNLTISELLSLCSFPIATATYYYPLIGLNNVNLLSYSSESQKFKISFTR